MHIMKYEDWENIRWLKPFKSMEELEEAVALLDDWTVPGELQKYLEILYRLTAFDISSECEFANCVIEGLLGTFLVNYSSNVREAALAICRTKFPVDIWDYPEGELSRLKEGYPKEVNYLGNYAYSPVGLNYIVERTNFVYDYELANGCRLDKRMTFKEMIQLEKSAVLYLVKQKKQRK